MNTVRASFLKVQGSVVEVLITFHALRRARTWRLSLAIVLQALLLPEEVLRGHRGRFIAHRRVKQHVTRVVYERENQVPVVVTCTARPRNATFGAEEHMKIAYSRDADALIIQLRSGRPADSRDLGEGVIRHLSKRGEPLEIEILDASKVIQKKDIEVSMGALFPDAGCPCSSDPPPS